VKQLLYDSCDSLPVSDHLPVIAVYEAEVVLPPPLSSFSYPSQLMFSDLKVTTNYSSNSLPSNCNRQKTCIQFQGPFLTENSRYKRTTQVQLHRMFDDEESPLIAEWASNDAPMLICTIGDPTFVIEEKILFCIKCANMENGGDDIIIMSGVIRLGDILGDLIQYVDRSNPDEVGSVADTTKKSRRIRTSSRLQAYLQAKCPPQSTSSQSNASASISSASSASDASYNDKSATSTNKSSNVDDKTTIHQQPPQQVLQQQEPMQTHSVESKASDPSSPRKGKPKSTEDSSDISLPFATVAEVKANGQGILSGIISFHFPFLANVEYQKTIAQIDQLQSSLSGRSSDNDIIV
jgi:hypothetical protein